MGRLLLPYHFTVEHIPEKNVGFAVYLNRRHTGSAPEPSDKDQNFVIKTINKITFALIKNNFTPNGQTFLAHTQRNPNWMTSLIKCKQAAKEILLFDLFHSNFSSSFRLQIRTNFLTLIPRYKITNWLQLPYKKITKKKLFLSPLEKNFGPQ